MPMQFLEYQLIALYGRKHQYTGKIFYFYFQLSTPKWFCRSCPWATYSRVRKFSLIEDSINLGTFSYRIHFDYKIVTFTQSIEKE